ncbi:MAG: MGMT family protein [bacterium]|nr:MGMT family protein [bacterium]
MGVNEKRRGVSGGSFDERVYAVVRRVPAGYVTTYKLVAAAVGCGSARAVGQALRRNRRAPEVPCHRVIRSDLRVGGFCGEEVGEQVEMKLALLAAEGVVFEGGKLAERKRVIGGEWVREGRSSVQGGAGDRRVRR